jgi:hypothetical protein
MSTSMILAVFIARAAAASLVMTLMVFIAGAAAASLVAWLVITARRPAWERRAIEYFLKPKSLVRNRPRAARGQKRLWSRRPW